MSFFPTLGRHTLSGAHPFSIAKHTSVYLLSDQHFGRSRVLNGLVYGVSVPGPFTNDTGIFSISRVMCANT